MSSCELCNITLKDEVNDGGITNSCFVFIVTNLCGTVVYVVEMVKFYIW